MPADPERIQAVFCKAVEAEGHAGRDRVLEQECHGDQELRRRVGALLRAHDAAGGILDRPIIGNWVFGPPDDDPGGPS